MAEDDWLLSEFIPKDRDETWFFRKNLSDEIGEKRKEYSHLIYLTFYYAPAPNGYSTPEDNDTFHVIECEELARLESATSTLVVAVVTKPGLKDFILYSRRPDQFLESACFLKGKFPQFDIEVEYTDDKDWTQYDDIPPSCGSRNDH